MQLRKKKWDEHKMLSLFGEMTTRALCIVRVKCMNNETRHIVIYTLPCNVLFFLLSNHIQRDVHFYTMHTWVIFLKTSTNVYEIGFAMYTQRNSEINLHNFNGSNMWNFVCFSMNLLLRSTAIYRAYSAHFKVDACCYIYNKLMEWLTTSFLTQVRQSGVLSKRTNNDQQPNMVYIPIHISRKTDKTNSLTDHIDIQ